MVIEYRFVFYTLVVNSLVANSPRVSQAALADCYRKYNYFHHQHGNDRDNLDQ